MAGPPAIACLLYQQFLALAEPGRREGVGASGAVMAAAGMIRGKTLDFRAGDASGARGARSSPDGRRGKNLPTAWPTPGVSAFSVFSAGASFLVPAAHGAGNRGATTCSRSSAHMTFPGLLGTEARTAAIPVPGWSG